MRIIKIKEYKHRDDVEIEYEVTKEERQKIKKVLKIKRLTNKRLKTILIRALEELIKKYY